VRRCCEAPNASGEVINVAAGGRVSLLEVVRALEIVLNRQAEPVFEPAREGDVRDSQADIFKARKLLGFEPVVPFDEGLKRTVAWQQLGASSPARS
jgi:nucleoside-diphosphate-sugar epimerase